jgi:hypothetical protein
MRVVAIPALFLLLCCLVAVPMASAKPVPPNPCYEQEIAPGVWFNRACGVTVELRAMSCPLAGSWKDHWVGNNNVRVYTCDPPQ